jgi:hypothetical protein
MTEDWQGRDEGFVAEDCSQRQRNCILLQAKANRGRVCRAQGRSRGCLWNRGRKSKRFHKETLDRSEHGEITRRLVLGLAPGLWRFS